jgi:hypothetical protein
MEDHEGVVVHGRGMHVPFVLHIRKEARGMAPVRTPLYIHHDG